MDITDTLQARGQRYGKFTGQPSDEEGPSAEDVEELCEEHCFNVEGYESIECLQGLINEAIARWGRPAPAPPADGEVAELAAWLQEEADDYECIGCEDSVARCKRAAELLERQASPACVVLKPSPELIEAFQDALPGRIEPLLEERHPAPVPVGERLPLPEVGE